MSPDNKKRGSQPGTLNDTDLQDPFFGGGDFDEIDALQPFDGEPDVGGDTMVVSLNGFSQVEADVQRAAKADISIAATRIEHLPADRTVILELSNGHPSQAITKSVTIIGRAQSGADLVLPDDGQISRQHAALIYAKGEFYLEDLQSSNGTFLDGQRI